MYFTKDDILKILRYLMNKGIKDSEMPEANIPISNIDTISIVQDNLNKKISVLDFISQLGFLHNEDFINVTDRFDEPYITLEEAVLLIPENKRKEGLVITFQGTSGNWRMYQFKGDILQFNNQTLWKEVGSGSGSGYTFIPHVSEEGVLSWTNDGDLENPDPVNIKGNTGDTPNISIGDVRTGVPGGTASAIITGTTSDLKLNMVIPQGPIGLLGEKGESFTYDDFTTEQLNALKGAKGDKGDTGATGAKGDTGISPQARIYNNKLLISLDEGQSWTDNSDYIAAWFKWIQGSSSNSLGKLQISRDNVTWEDLSEDMVNNLYIKGYVSSTSLLPSDAILGDIYMVGPTYDTSDTSQTYPHYRMYVKQSSGWVDTGEFTSIAAGIVQERGSNENAIMSQKATSEALTELEKPLKTLQTEVLGINFVNLEIGTYYPDTNTYLDDLRTRVRTPRDSYYHLNRGDVISLSDFSVAKIRIARFINGVYTDYTPWLMQDYICPSDGDYKLCITSVPEVVQTDVSTLADLLIINMNSSFVNVRKDVLRLGEDVANINMNIGGEEIIDLSNITTYGRYIDTNIDGNTYVNESWAYAAPIYLRKGLTIKVKTQGYEIDVIASCDSEGSTNSFKRLVRPNTSSGLTEYRYTAQSDMYVAVSYKYTMNDTEVSIQGEEFLKSDDVQSIESNILSLQDDINILFKKLYGENNITNKFTLSLGQTYGSVGSNIMTSPDDTRYQHIYLTDVKDRSISVKVPPTASPSSLVQYVDSNGKITRLFGVGYTDGQTFDFMLRPFDIGESGVYISSATGYLSIFEVNKNSNSLFEKFTAQTRLGNNTLITSHLCAHRGLAGSSREIRYNDLELCYNAGFKRIETDLVNSSDGIIYCSHNGYVNGTYIPNMTSEQVDSAASGDNRVLRLEEVILFCKTHDIILEMDMANTSRLIDDYVGNVVDLVRIYNAFSTCIFVASKSRIQNIYNLANNIMVCISSGATSEGSDTRTDAQVKSALDNCVSSMTPMYSEVSMAYGTTGQNITKERVSYAHELGFAVKVYLTTDDTAGASFDTVLVMKDLFNMGVDCMLTDVLIPNNVSDGLIYLIARKLNNANK